MEAYQTATDRPRFRPRRTRRVFSIEQANRALPLVSRIVRDIVDQHRDICKLEEFCQVPRPGWSARTMEDVRRDYADALDQLRDLIDELTDVGAQLKDWRRGIVDFPAFHEGRPVEFCWRLGEKRICHWHEPDAGFRCRQPIDDEFVDVAS